MALFGDFGKVFLGGATAGDVAGAVTGFATGSPSLAASAAKTVGGFSEAISGIGESDRATAPVQAGIDSPATLNPVSQTSQIFTTQPMATDFYSQEAAASLGLPAITRGLTNLGRAIQRNPVGFAFGGGSLVGAGLQFLDEFGNPPRS